MCSYQFTPNSAKSPTAVIVSWLYEMYVMTEAGVTMLACQSGSKLCTHHVRYTRLQAYMKLNDEGTFLAPLTKP